MSLCPGQVSVWTYMTGMCHTLCVSMAMCNFSPAVFGVGGQVLVVKLSFHFLM